MEAVRGKLDTILGKIDNADDKTDRFKTKTRRSIDKYHASLSEIGNLKRKIQEIKETLQLTNKAVLQSKNKLVEYETAIHSSEQIKSRLEHEYSIKEEKMSNIEDKIKDEKRKHLDILSSYEEARSRKQRLQEELAKFTAIRKAKEHNLYDLKKDVRDGHEEIRRLNSLYKKTSSKEQKTEEILLDKYARANEKQQELFGEIQSLKNQIALHTESLVKTRNQKREVQNEMRDIIHELETI